MRKIGVDFEIVMPKGKTGGGADILDRESDRDADHEKDQRVSQAIDQTGVRQGAGNKERRQRLRKWRWVPGKSDERDEKAGNRQP